jgi:mono/diheme cytochrome c family protein
MNEPRPEPRRPHKIRWILGAVVLAAVLVTAYEGLGPSALAFAGGQPVALAEFKGEDPTGVPGALRSAGLIERGQYLTRAADCVACHTAEGGTPYTGGRAFVLPFGTLYSTNITPDPATGIGGYSDAQFIDAMRRGIGPNHERLYPAMPYASYAYLSDGDVLAIKAYLFSLAPANAPAPANTLSFPFNQRSLMAIWAALFDSDRRFEPHPERSGEWNRGAYLAEALAHCGECHTPRNLFFALDNRNKYAGAVQAGWRAFNITPDREAGIGTWSAEDLAHYLSSGHADGRGTAAGPMGEAVDNSLRYLTAEDIAALTAYVRSVTPGKSEDLPMPRESPAPRAPIDAQTAGLDPRGQAVYEGACAGCHGWTGESPVLAPASLVGTRAVNDPSALNVAQIVIHGGPRHTSNDPGNMPAFGSSYSDEEIASVANYVTGRFGAKGSTLTAASIAKIRTQE